MLERRDIPNYPGYQVDIAGNVYSCWCRGNQYKKSYMTDNWHRLKEGRSSSGYMSVVLCKGGKMKSFFLHRLVLEAFVGLRDAVNDLVARHLDGNVMNNNLDNLQWGTRKENIADSVRHGTFKPPPITQGSYSPGAKLTEEDVIRIKESNNGYAEIGREYGVTEGTIRFIKNGITWKHVEGVTILTPRKFNPFKGSKSHFSKLKEEDILEIRRLLEMGECVKDISKIYKVSSSTISQIKHKRIWTSV